MFIKWLRLERQYETLVDIASAVLQDKDDFKAVCKVQAYVSCVVDLDRRNTNSELRFQRRGKCSERAIWVFCEVLSRQDTLRKRTVVGGIRQACRLGRRLVRNTALIKQKTGCRGGPRLSAPQRLWCAFGHNYVQGAQIFCTYFYRCK